MNINVYGTTFICDDSEQGKAELRVFTNYYKELQRLLRKDNCDYYYMPVIPTANSSYSITPLITKDLLVIEITNTALEFQDPCIFNDIKLTANPYSKSVHKMISEHSYQLDYPRELINKWMSELSNIRQLEFIRNDAIYNKYELVRSRLEETYHTEGTPHTAFASSKEENISLEEITKAAFIRDTRPVIDKLSELELAFDDIRNQFNDKLIREYSNTSKETRQLVKKYGISLRNIGLSEENTLLAVDELCKGTVVGSDEYKKDIRFIYDNNISNEKEFSKVMNKTKGMSL